MAAKKPHPLKRAHHLTVIPGMVCAIILGVMVLGYSAMLLANLATRDEAIPDTSDLVLPTLDVAATNGYPALAAALLTHPITDTDAATITSLTTSHDWTNAAAATLVSTYDADLNAFATASTAPTLQDPKFLDQHSTELSLPVYNDQTLQDIRTLARLMLIDAHRQAVGGNFSTALTEATAVANVGQRLGNSRNTYLAHSFSASLLIDGLTAFRDLASQSTLSPAELRTLTALLPDGDIHHGTIEAELVEFAWSTTGLNTVNANSFIMESLPVVPGMNGFWFLPTSFTWAVMSATYTTNFIYLPSQTFRLRADLTRTQVERSALPCTQVQAAPSQPTFTTNSPLTTKNIIGRSAVEQARQAFSRIDQSRCNTAAYAALVRAAVAVHAFISQTGNAPGSLTALVPAYLDNLPIDPYSGQPIKYDAAKHVVYSVGINHRDQTGSTRPQSWDLESNPTVDTTAPSTQLTATTPASAYSNVYYIAVGDNGKSGKLVGCGDSLVAVKRTLGQGFDFNQNATVLLTSLLSDHSATIGESGLQNALADSRLVVSSITFNNATSKLDVKLAGTMSSSGTCQDPRIKGQLEETLFPFRGANGLNITVNNQPLATVLSTKGQ